MPCCVCSNGAKRISLHVLVVLLVLSRLIVRVLQFVESGPARVAFELELLVGESVTTLLAFAVLFFWARARLRSLAMSPAEKCLFLVYQCNMVSLMLLSTMADAQIADARRLVTTRLYFAQFVLGFLLQMLVALLASDVFVHPLHNDFLFDARQPAPQGEEDVIPLVESAKNKSPPPPPLSDLRPQRPAPRSPTVSIRSKPAFDAPDVVDDELESIELEQVARSARSPAGRRNSKEKKQKKKSH